MPVPVRPGTARQAGSSWKVRRPSWSPGGPPPACARQRAYVWLRPAELQSAGRVHWVEAAEQVLPHGVHADKHHDEGLQRTYIQSESDGGLPRTHTYIDAPGVQALTRHQVSVTMPDGHSHCMCGGLQLMQ